MTQSIYPVLRYRDPVALIDWLERVLGFERAEVHVDDDGVVQHAQLRFEGTMVMAGTGPSSTGGLYLATGDVDALHARATEAGASPTAIEDRDYGSREFALTDPEGFDWWVGTYRPN